MKPIFVSNFYILCALLVGAFGCESFEDAADDGSKSGTTVLRSGEGNGLKAEYYNEMDFTKLAFERVDSKVDFSWGKGSPDSRIASNTFSARWTGFVQAELAETYTFYLVSDDGAKLWVNDKLVVSDWSDHGPRERSGKIFLEAGKRYSLRAEYYENGGGAVMKLLWSSPGVPKQAVPGEHLFLSDQGDGEGGAQFCAETGEHGSAILSCAAGENLTRIDFASYGLPAGSCDGGFQEGTCHAASSKAKIEELCLNKSSCSVSASNGTFGDPCRGTFKRLAIIYTCGGDNQDQCPDDPRKTEPGICGCGVPEGSCTPEATLYEAESNTAVYGSHKATNHAGYSGTGFIDYGGNGTWIEWNNIDGKRAGEYLLTFRYAVGGKSARRAKVFVNGQDAGDVAFGSTAAWTSWKTDSVRVSLKQGFNGIRVLAFTTAGGPNLDNMEVTFLGDDGKDQCPDDPGKTEPGICGCGTPEDSCDVPNYSRLVYPDQNGRLVYEPDANGNTIPDFSYVGYKNGERMIPDVPVVRTITPLSGDNRAHIQNAINQVGNMALKNGVRGALLLKKGEYKVNGTININKSGIVIRGEGNGAGDTRVIATKRTQHDLFRFSGSGGPSEVSSSKVKILGSYISVGARTFNVGSHGFKAGDTVYLTRVPKQSWIAMLGMDKLENSSDPDDFNWTTGEYTMRYKRVVKGIAGNRITLDAPLVDPIDEKYATGYLSRYSWSKKITQVGIENIRLISEYSGDTDESHGWNAVVMHQLQDAWVRNIESHYFGYSAVNILSGGYRISVLNSKQMYPKSQTRGGRKYSFAVNGQLVLVKDCFAHSGRHDFVGHARTPGPNAFVDCWTENQLSDIGPHHRWSTGILFDNIEGTRDMAVQNRMYSGSGHGWSGAQTMFWNCTMNKIIIQSPPNHINWAIGNISPNFTSRGAYVDVPGYTESNNEHVWPQSLYEQQLGDRLGK